MTELKIPRPGESINEVVISKWFVEEGDFVEKDQEIGEIESDKATLPLISPQSGKIKILISIGTTALVGAVACTIDESITSGVKKLKIESPKVEKIAAIIEPAATIVNEVPSSNHWEAVKISPLARNLMEEKGLTVDDIIQGLKRISKEEVLAVIENKDSSNSISQKPLKVTNSMRELKSEPMSQLRKKLSKRLVAVKNDTAMLTTFNELDMSNLVKMRAENQKQFTAKHGVKLGYMSFFSKAVSIALLEFPKVNSQLENENIVTPSFVDIAFAVQTDKGLMVPVLRNTESMTLAEIEIKITQLAEKARAARLSIDEMTGGTFTITNGGVFGSLLSTPIINPPQSAILGMHNIVDRPVAINGKVEIRPMMYIALSYDHRIIDGRDSVSFLVRVKELLETPYKMLINERDPDKILLGL